MKNRVLAVMFLGLLAATPLWAQTGQISGTISDPSGAVIQGARVTVTNPATGLTRTVETGASGSYTVAQLPPGTYDLKVEHQGFSTASKKALELLVGQQLTFNVTLKPGGATEILEVTDEAPLIESTRSEIGGSVTPLEVRELPLIDRNFSALTQLVPGVRPAQNFDPTKTRVGNVSLNGGDGRQFDVTVDGGDNKDNVVGGMVQNYTLEGIQEFSVITNRYSAESGRTLGGIVTVVSKYGTNTLHGSLFGLFQISTFNKKSFFTRTNGADGLIGTSDDDTSLPKPVYHRYHFGGSVGGALMKDKLFVFGAYEHKREPGSISVDPTAFLELSQFSTPAVSAEPVSQLAVPYKDHLLTVRVDHRINDNQSMFYRYGRQRWENPNDQLGDPFVTDLSQTTSNTNQFHDLVIGHNWVISARKVNSFGAHFSDFVNVIGATQERMFTLPTATGTATNPRIFFPSGEIGQNENVPQQTLQRKYQVRDDFSLTHNRHNIKFGGNYIYTAKLGGFFFFGANGYSIGFWDDPTVILGDLVTYPQGFATPGALRQLNFSGGNGGFGQRVHQLAFYFQDDYKVTPRLTFNLGLRWDANIHLLPQQLGSGLSDTNRTVGILQELLAANPAAPGAADGLARAALLAGNDDELRRRTPSFKEFQPRVGFAWDPTGSGKHIVRGGYGIAFDQVFQNLTVFSIQQSHPGIYQTSINQNNDARPGACTVDPINNPLCTFAFGVTALPVASGGEELEFGGLGFLFDPKAVDPYAQQLSIGWQWQFHPDWAFTADYYHVLGLREPRILQMNPQIREVCDPGFPSANPLDPRCVAGPTTRFFDAALDAAGLCGPTLAGPVCGAGRLGEMRTTAFNNRSNFDSVNLQVKKRFNRRYMLQASYVLSWSNAWGGRPTSSYGGTALNISPDRQFLPNESGPSNFDERHRLVFSGHFQLPGGVEVSPIFQAASARALNWRTNSDLDGDGRATLDRVCVGSTLAAPVTTLGCTFVGVNPLRGDPTGILDVRFAKAFTFKERLSLRLYWEFFNLFDTNNFGNSLEERITSANFFRQRAYLGTGTSDGAGRGFGGGAIGPMRSQFGFRLTF